MHGKRRRTLRRGSRKEGRQAFDPRTSLPPPSAPPGGACGSAVGFDVGSDADCGSDVGEQVFR